MRKLFFSLLFFILSFSSVRSQNLIDFSYDWLDTNLFHSVHATALGDWFISPVTMDTVGVWQDGEPQVQPLFSFGIGLVSVGYEPRLNIYNYYDYISVSVSAPVTASFSAISGRTAGVFNLHVPLMVEGNFFGQSVYNSYDQKGFSIGLGARYTLAPIVVIDQGDSKRHWVTPQARLGFKWENSYGEKRSANVSFGFTKPYRYRTYSQVNPSGYRTKTTLSGFCFLFTVAQILE